MGKIMEGIKFNIRFLFELIFITAFFIWLIIGIPRTLYFAIVHGEGVFANWYTTISLDEMISLVLWGMSIESFLLILFLWIVFRLKLIKIEVHKNVPLV